MNREKQQEYAARISQANRTELLVIVYEILEEEIHLAEQAFQEREFQTFDQELQTALQFLQELMGTLNFEYEISGQLLSLYRFINKVLIEDRMKKQPEYLAECAKIVADLRKAYEEVARQDHSGSLMVNTQKLYAGLTYGKHSLEEVSMDEKSGSRGYYA